jgi:hypothetical protein
VVQQWQNLRLRWPAVRDLEYRIRLLPTGSYQLIPPHPLHEGRPPHCPPSKNRLALMRINKQTHKELGYQMYLMHSFVFAYVPALTKTLRNTFPVSMLLFS